MLSRAGTGTECETYTLFFQVPASLCNVLLAPALAPLPSLYLFIFVSQSSLVWNSSPWFQTLVNYIFTKKPLQHIPSPNNPSSTACSNSTTHMEVHFPSPHGVLQMAPRGQSVSQHHMLSFIHQWNDLFSITSHYIRDCLMSWGIHMDWGLILGSPVTN